jgi:uncharacterized protein YecT (DUF1311 family)
MGHALMRIVWASALAMVAFAAPVHAQGAKPSVRATKAIEDCIKNPVPAGKHQPNAEGCIGIVSDPCLDNDNTKSTADMNACIDREQAVWDEFLNETYRRLRAKLDDKQKVKLRDMQRAWIESRNRTCAFYWDFFQGTMASPMSTGCVNRETARRALFLLGFLNDADAK